MVIIGWIFFRSENIKSSLDYLAKMFIEIDFPLAYRGLLIYYVTPFIFIEYLNRKNPRMNFEFKINYLLELLLMSLVFIIIMIHFGRSKIDFIYFQF